MPWLIRHTTLLAEALHESDADSAEEALQEYLWSLSAPLGSGDSIMVEEIEEAD